MVIVSALNAGKLMRFLAHIVNTSRIYPLVQICLLLGLSGHTCRFKRKQCKLIKLCIYESLGRECSLRKRSAELSTGVY